MEKRELADAGRSAGPSCAIIDSQSVKTTSAAEERGIDGGKNKKWGAGAARPPARPPRPGPALAFFLDGLGESSIRCFGVLEGERDAVMARVGLRVYGPPSEGFMRTLPDRGSHPELDLFRGLDGPSGFTHRYVSEDAACGLAMLVSLGRRYGVPVPLTEAFLAIAGVLGGRDYAAQGRTLESLGLAGLTAEQLLAAL